MKICALVLKFAFHTNFLSHTDIFQKSLNHIQNITERTNPSQSRKPKTFTKIIFSIYAEESNIFFLFH